MRAWRIKLGGSLALAALAAAIVQAADNPTNDALLKRSQVEQKRALERVVGDNCRAVRVFFAGQGVRGFSRGRAFWSVACADGRKFFVMLSPNQGEDRVMECKMARALGMTPCFTKIRE